MNSTSIGVKRDYVIASKYYYRASENGSRDGLNALGVIREHGYGVAQDYGISARLYRKSAILGCALAKADYGLCFLEGRGVSKDKEQGVALLQDSIAHGCTYAAVNYANCLLEEMTSDKTKDEATRTKIRNLAIECCMLGIKDNWSLAHAYFGRLLYMGEFVKQDYKKAIEHFRKSTTGRSYADGVPLGYYYMAQCLYHGRGIEQNIEQAVTYLKHAADNGEEKEDGVADAEYMYGKCLEKGIGVTQNFEKAVHYYERAALHGSPHAQYRMGMYHYNLITKVPTTISKEHKKKAFDYFSAGKRNAHPPCITGLGHCYEMGYGTDIDMTMAVECYKIAADKEDALGAYKYAQCLWNGFKTPENDNEIRAYYERAVKLALRDNRYTYILWNDQTTMKEDFVWSLCDKGSHWAQAQMGWILFQKYRAGNHDENIIKKAVELICLSAEKGNPWGLNLLAVLSKSNHFVDRSIGSMTNLIRDQLSVLNSHLTRMDGVFHDVSRFFTASCSAGILNTRRTTGRIMENAAISLQTTDSKRACDFRSIAIRCGNATAMNNYAWQLWNDRESNTGDCSISRMSRLSLAFFMFLLAKPKNQVAYNNYTGIKAEIARCNSEHPGFESMDENIKKYYYMAFGLSLLRSVDESETLYSNMLCYMAWLSSIEFHPKYDNEYAHIPEPMRDTLGNDDKDLYDYWI